MGDKSEVIISAGMALIIQAMQLILELARLYGVDSEQLKQLMDQEYARFAANDPAKLPSPPEEAA